jgi:hypothetical protein
LDEGDHPLERRNDVAEEGKQDTFEITTTAQYERVYTVQAKDEDQAKARLKVHLKDPETLREGIVTEQADRQKDTTTRQMTDTKKVSKPRAVPAAAASDAS